MKLNSLFSLAVSCVAAVHHTEASSPYEDVPALPQDKPSSTMAVEGRPVSWSHISSVHYTGLLDLTSITLASRNPATPGLLSTSSTETSR